MPPELLGDKLQELPRVSIAKAFWSEASEAFEFPSAMSDSQEKSSCLLGCETEFKSLF